MYVEFIMAVRRRRDIPFDIPLPIVLHDSFYVFKYNSFSRGYRSYKNEWQPTVGNNSLNCK